MKKLNKIKTLAIILLFVGLFSSLIDYYILQNLKDNYQKQLKILDQISIKNYLSDVDSLIKEFNYNLEVLNKKVDTSKLKDSIKDRIKYLSSKCQEIIDISNSKIENIWNKKIIIINDIKIFNDEIIKLYNDTINELKTKIIIYDLIHYTSFIFYLLALMLIFFISYKYGRKE